MHQDLPGGYRIDDDRGRLDFPRLHAWLSATYWSPGIPLDVVRAGAENSTLVLGCWREGLQVGYLRLVSDKVRFAYFMDVYVDADHRKRGLAREMVRFAMAHPDLQGVYLWLLATHDAQPVYAEVGFQPLPRPENWMILKKDMPWARAPASLP